MNKKRCIKRINENKTNGQRTVTIPKDWPHESEYVELFPVPENKAIKQLKKQQEDE